ncbi:hypothetical protein D1872_252710 [compost metagenome]
MVLEAVADMDVRRRGFAVHDGQLDDVIRRHAGDRRNALRRVLLHMLAQFGIAGCVALHERFVDETAFEQNMHHTERKRAVRPRVQRDKPVRPLPRAIAVHVDDHKLRSLLAGLFDQGDLMHVRTDQIAAPNDN